MPLLDLSGVLIDASLLRRSKDFSVIFTGRMISLFGLGMLAVALNLQAWQMTGSAAMLALVNALLGVGTFLGTLLGGVAADRYERRRLILLTRCFALAGFVALFLNSLLPEPWFAVLCLVGLWDGFFGAMSAAALAATVPRLVDDASYGSAGALLTLSADIGAITAPLLAGFLIDHTNMATVYGLVCLMTAVSVLALLRLSPCPPGEQPNATSVPASTADPGSALAPELASGFAPGFAPGSVVGSDVEPDVEQDVEQDGRSSLRAGWWEFIGDLRDCMAFVKRDRYVGVIVYLGCIQLCLASPHVLIPAFVTQVLNQSATAVGLLFAAPAAGAIVAAIVSGFADHVKRPERILIWLFIVGSAGMVGFGLSTSLWLCAGIMAGIGALDAYTQIFRFLTISKRTPDALRGRVSSLWMAQNIAGDVAGGPLLALLARFFGPAGAIVVGGIAATALSLTGLGMRGAHKPERLPSTTVL